MSDKSEEDNKKKCSNSKEKKTGEHTGEQSEHTGGYTRENSGEHIGKHISMGDYENIDQNTIPIDNINIENINQTSIPSHSGQGDGRQFIYMDPRGSTGDIYMERRHNDWMIFGVRLAAAATLHPFEYAKVLIQLGHEPLPAVACKTIFGKSTMLYPNLFKYVGHIRRVDGFFGCYRGLTPKIMGSLVSVFGGEQIAHRMKLGYDHFVDESDSYDHFVFKLKRDIVLISSGLIISHPFHVISLRMMAEFVGRETIYKNMFESIREIYRSDGLCGFFKGLIPKMLCDLTCVVVTSSLAYMVNKYYLKGHVVHQYSTNIIQYVVSTLLYPLQVVSTCMAVTSSRLKAGQPPIMAGYKNWFECWVDLEARGELNRGGSFFWRYIGVPPKHPFAHYKILAIQSKIGEAS